MPLKTLPDGMSVFTSNNFMGAERNEKKNKKKRANMNVEHKFQFGPKIAPKMRRHENMGRVRVKWRHRIMRNYYRRTEFEATMGKAVPEPILTFILLACKICMQFLPHSHSRNFNLFAAKIIRELIAGVSLSVKCVCVCGCDPLRELSQMFVA